jgi:hypothetical protein
MTRDDEIREQLRNVIQIIRPYAMAQGRFHDIADLRAAITLARQYLERVEALVARRAPGGSGA